MVIRLFKRFYLKLVEFIQKRKEYIQSTTYFNLMKRYFLFVLASLIILAPAFASNIETKVTAGESQLVIQSINIGPKPIYNIKISVTGESVLNYDRLNPDDRVKIISKKHFRNGALLNPVFIKTKYQDHNGNKVSSVGLSVKGKPRGQTVIAAKSTSDDIEVYLQNVEGDNKDVKVSLSHPDKSRFSKTHRRISLNDKGEHKFRFKSKSKSDLMPKLYHLFGIDRFDKS